MTWIWLITGLILGLLCCGAALLIYRWVNKRPAFELKQGVKVYTHLNSESKRTKKKEIETYLTSYIGYLVEKNLFTNQQLLRIIGKTHLSWKIQPFWNKVEKEFHSGNRTGNNIIVGWKPNINKTALAHEYMHFFLYELKGTGDSNHLLKAYWTAADGFSGPKP